MPRDICTLWLTFTLSAFLFGSCKQKSKEEADPAPQPSASVAPEQAAPPTPPPPDTIPPPMQPPAVAPAAAGPKGGGESLKTCCAALHKQADTATGADKSLYQNTATSCEAISKLVASGTTKKAAALTTLRAGLKGAKLPAGCD